MISVLMSDDMVTDINDGVEICASCNGSGSRISHDEGVSQKCIACDGKGRVLVNQPSRKCPECNGTGWIRIGSAGPLMPCPNCKGTGWPRPIII